MYTKKQGKVIISNEAIKFKNTKKIKINYLNYR